MSAPVRYGPMRKVYGECSCGGTYMGIGDHTPFCYKTSDAIYERDVLERCPISPMRLNEHDHPHKHCPRCADSPEPGWVVKQQCQCGVVGRKNGHKDDCSDSVYSPVTQRLTVERFGEIAARALAERGQAVFWWLDPRYAADADMALAVQETLTP